jgi:hypothetical protein
MARNIVTTAVKGYLKSTADLSGAPPANKTPGYMKTTAELSGAPVSDAQRCARCVGRATRKK